MSCKNQTLYLFSGGILLFVLTLLLAVKPVFASPPTSYYDWGSYYDNKEKVLGVTFSSLEDLPAPIVPKEVLPAPAQGILPGNPLYNFEILTENIQLTLTFNPVQRETQRLVFAEERLSEFKTLVEEGNIDLANNTASTYQNTMDTISKNAQTLSSQNVNGAGDLLTKVEDTAGAHAVVAQSLVFSFPPNTTASWNKVIDATEKAMDVASDAQGLPAIPEELSVSIQELKEQGLISPEESNKLYAFSSRADVRGELNKLVTSGEFPSAEVIKLNQTVAKNYPENYKDTQEVLKFAELRTYETLPPPSVEILNEIVRWQGDSADIPPPGEIRPYLYYSRAQELAKEIDLSRFEPDQQSEIASFHPESVVQNPTFSNTPATSPSPSPSPTPTEQTTEQTKEEVPSPSPQPSPNPASAPIDPYLVQYSGPFPGTFRYFFKNIGEQVSLATTFDPARRLELEMDLADERLSEARVLSQEDGKEKLYEDTLNRYRQIMDSASDDLKDFEGKEEDKRNLAKALELESAMHNVIFEKGLLPQPSGDTKAYVAAIEASEDAMDKTSDVLGRPALPPQLANRLQDMKAQGIILEEEVSNLTEANSREEVRKKIRELTKSGIFPPADAKKLDEGQALVVPQDYNQLTEIRKIEELQGLRAVQAEFAQTATLRETGASYEQRVKNLLDTIDPGLIRAEDLGGREELIKTYREIAAKAPTRPINAGQFGDDVVPGISLPNTSSSSNDVSGTCPIGAFFKQSEGCVWEDTGKRIDDVTQYACKNSGQYWSFVARACVYGNFESSGAKGDGSPACPIGYAWSWKTSSCQSGAGDIIPSPNPQPSPQSCPEGSSYKAPRGCVWDANDKPILDETQYRCGGTSSYYSFSEKKCVPNPDPKKPFPEDATPTCKEKDAYWNWTQGGCVPAPQPPTTFQQNAEPLTPKPAFTTPDSPFYFLKQAVETVQVATAFGAEAREEVKLAQAKERLAEAYALLEKNDEKGFEESLGRYTGAMQSVFNDIDKGLNLTEEAKKELGEKLATDVTNQNLLLQKVSVLAGKDAATPISAATSVVIQGVDRASDLQGQPAIPEDVKEKLDALPEDMLSKKQKQKLADADTRLEARLITGELTATGALTQSDLASFDNWTAPADSESTLRLNEFKKLNEAVELTNLKEDIAKKVEKTEDIAEKLDEFKKSFEPGEEIPADVRPYVRLTRIDEISKTIRPDVIKLEDFGNRKDIQLAIAALQQEFKPTSEDFRRIEDFRRSNPGRPLTAELARIEALSFSIGVRDSATTCFLPSPPFAPNTPCPPTGASIPISSYYTGAPFSGIGGFGVIADEFRPGWPGGPSASVDKDGKPLVYGKGPEASKPGVCQDGYHWMYDSGGWCMSNSGNYSSTTSYSQGPYSSGPGYTPYSSYYTAPGAPSYGYQGPGTYSNFINTYSPPNYYGTAPTAYTTNPPPGTVPGTGPTPTSPGQCPSGYHWMAPSSYQGGWCMADGGTYTGSAGSGYYGGSVTPGTQCPSGSYWNSYYNSCQSAGGQTYYPLGGYGGYTNYGPSPNLTRESCGPGYYWSGNACYPNPTYSGGSGYGGTSCGVGPPSSGCGYNSYWDYGSCSCRNSSTYSGGSSSSTGSSCSPPPGGCGSGWYDNSSCSCKAASSQGCYNVSASSCGSGFYWDSGACTCRSSGTSSSSTGTTSTSGGTSSGSCPSGYHWMSDNGGWCMSDGTTGGGGTTSTPTSTESTSPPPPTTTESTPPPSEPAPTASP